MTICEQFEVGVIAGEDPCSVISLAPSEALTPVVVPALPAIRQNYQLSRTVACGDHWQVYETASNEQFTNKLALKTLQGEKTFDARAQKRFQRYAKGALALSHANLTSLYDAGISDQGDWYVLTDWCAGEPLDHVIEGEGFLEESFALDIFIQVAEALSYAHSMGVLHLNLKPEKVFLTRTSIDSAVAKVADCGLARVPAILEEEAPLDQLKPLSNPHYMSPEVCLGQKLDGRSDIYSMGCMMYKALVGKPPYDAASPSDIMLKHVRECPIAFEKILKDHGISRDLEAIVMRCLKRDPNLRYQSMLELLQDLQCVELGQRPGNLYRASAHVSVSKKPVKSATRVMTVAWIVLGLCMLGTVSGIIVEVSTGNSPSIAHIPRHTE